MSKIQIHIATAQKQQVKSREKSAKYVPGTITIQVIGCGAAGSPATVYLFTDQSRYLFNCGEGTQRLAHEHKTKLTRLEHIFVTRRSWHCFGGLPGLSLTIQDAGVSNISIHGPSKLDSIFHAMRKFVVLKNLNVNAPICTTGGCYEDNVFKAHYIPLSDEGHNDDQSVMAYICECKPRPGALSASKCLQLGVPKGPLLGKLKNGETITLVNGTTIHAEDVREPDDPGPTFLVIDTPSLGYLRCFQKSERFMEYLKSNFEDASRNDLILHFAPASVTDAVEYKAFIQSFPKFATHLMLNEQNRFSGYAAAHRLQWQLNQLNSQIFPILREPVDMAHNEEPESAAKKIKLNEAHPNQGAQKTNNAENIENAAPMTFYHLRPPKNIDRSCEVKVNPPEYIKETADIDGFTEALENMRQNRPEAVCAGRESQYPKIVFLGTGSCIPNKTRNVSSILVHTTKDSCILLDVGEGTCGQIYRFYGSEAPNVICKIKAVYVSHLHADHHIGLIGIIQERQKILKTGRKPIILLAPGEMQSWLQYYDNEIEPIYSEIEFIENRTLIQSSLDEAHSNELGLSLLRTCYVVHCANAFGIALTLNNDGIEPFKLTYSGDSKPCDTLIELGMDSTLLIHEATMEDELYEDALAKMHSTVSQAIEQGHKMNAKYVLLTHFSQRYAKIPRIEQHLVENVGIAFDNMEVVASDLRELNVLYPTMKIMFAEHWDEMEQKSIKRAHKRAIEQSND